MDEVTLINKLRSIEAHYAGAKTQGERMAAGHARQRILKRLKLLEKKTPAVEHRFTLSEMWSRRVFLALLRSFGLRSYRVPRRRYTTVMVRVTSRFVNETLRPEFQEIYRTLLTYLTEVTGRVVSEVVHEDSSEAKVEQPRSLQKARLVTFGFPARNARAFRLSVYRSTSSRSRGSISPARLSAHLRHLSAAFPPSCRRGLGGGGSR